MYSIQPPTCFHRSELASVSSRSISKTTFYVHHMIFCSPEENVSKMLIIDLEYQLAVHETKSRTIRTASMSLLVRPGPQCNDKNKTGSSIKLTFFGYFTDTLKQHLKKPPNASLNNSFCLVNILIVDPSIRLSTRKFLICFWGLVYYRWLWHNRGYQLYRYKLCENQCLNSLQIESQQLTDIC